MKLTFPVSGSDITNAFGKSNVSFFGNAMVRWPAGNSYVSSAQYFSLEDAARSAFPNVPLSDMKIGLNKVNIDGKLPADEQLHYHKSSLMAMVTQGYGSCLYEKDGEEHTQIVREGDVAILPPGSLHAFEGNRHLEYVVLEFGPELDYQKHHY